MEKHVLELLCHTSNFHSMRFFDLLLFLIQIWTTVLKNENQEISSCGLLDDKNAFVLCHPDVFYSTLTSIRAFFDIERCLKIWRSWNKFRMTWYSWLPLYKLVHYRIERFRIGHGMTLEWVNYNTHNNSPIWGVIGVRKGNDYRISALFHRGSLVLFSKSKMLLVQCCVTLLTIHTSSWVFACIRAFCTHVTRSYTSGARLFCPSKNLHITSNMASRYCLG